MHIIQALLGISLLGVIFVGFVEVAERIETRERYAASAHFIRSVQNAVYEWHGAERQNTDVTGWDFPTDANDRQALTDRLPRNNLSGNLPDASINNRTLIWTDVSHGAGSEFALTWPGVANNPSIELRLLGDWEDDHINYLVGLIPTLRREDVTAADDWWVNRPSALRLTLPHPTSQAVLANSMRRSTVQSGARVGGLVSPLVFDTEGVIVRNDGCESTSALAVDTDGVPHGCVDHDSDTTTERIWRPISSTDVYCRDTRLSPGSPQYTQNSPGHVPVIETNWLSGAMNPGTSGFEVRVPAIDVNGAWQCPDPFTLEPVIPGVLSRFCTHTFN